MITTFFHIGFEIISYNYSQLCSHLEHLVIDFLVAKDKFFPSANQKHKYIQVPHLQHKSSKAKEHSCNRR
jgi:hypothetical protein